MPSVKPGFKYFLIRLIIFLGGFLVVSGIIGPWVVSSKLLYGDYFYIYGNLGKLVVYSAILFILLIRDKLPESPKPAIKSFNWWALGISVILLGVFFPVATNLVNNQTWTAFVLAHLLINAIPLLILVFAFEIKTLMSLGKKYFKELLICAGVSVVFDVAIFQAWKAWPFFSGIVLQAVKWLFSLTFTDVSVPAPLTIYVHGFGVQILEACSGVDSLFLFSSLYIIIAFLDWKKFNHKKIILYFLPAIIGLFLVNILRVYLIILGGVLISPEVTIKLFHTYAGMILFIVYFGLFWKVFYKKLILRKN